MNDRELLDMAAKAAGIQMGGTLHMNGSLDSSFERSFKPASGFGSGSDSVSWNPLTDDGDALRLAVKLDISLLGDFPGNIVVVAFDARRIIEKHDGDRLAATRRAIVRAAAQIGQSM